MRRRTYEITKRGLDAAFAAILLVISAPVLAIVAIVVLVTDGRPVIFSQVRPGRAGRPFALRKFRTMRPAEEDAGPHTDAARLTPVGAFLRSTSLDELPSLWNVLTGEMSFVGPRPLLLEYLPRYTAEQARRHEVRPGVTGLAQVNGRNAVDWEERLAWDVRYVDARSLALDYSIVLRTIVPVLARRGITASGHATMPEFRGTRAADSR